MSYFFQDNTTNNLQASTDNFGSSLPCPFLIINDQFNVIYENNEASQSFGSQLGHSIFEHVIQDSSKILKEDLIALSIGNKFIRNQIISCGVSDERCFKLTFKKILENGQTCISIIAIDASDQLAAKRKLHNLNLILSNSSEMIVFLDSQYNFLVANKTFLKAINLPLDYILGKSYIKIMGKFADEQNIKDSLFACHGKNTIKCQDWFNFPIQKRMHLDLRYDPVKAENNKLNGIIVSARDTTNLWKAEQKYKQVLDASEDGFWELNVRTLKIFLSKKIYTMLGYNPADFKNNELRNLPIIEIDDKKLLVENFKKFLRSRKDYYKSEFRAQTKDGDLKHILIRGKVIERTHSGFPIKLIGAHTDITAIREGQLELKKAKEEAERANNTKSEFLANMSHEIRTPLNAILGFTDILASSKGLEDNERSYLSSIKKSGSTLLALINDILDLSKIEAGRMDINSEVTDFYGFLKDVQQIFKHKCLQKGINFKLYLDESLPQYLIIDAIRLRQILFNLLGNAIKFTDKGFISLDIVIEKINANTLDLVIKINDTGIGIAKDQQEEIFEAFKQTGQNNKKYEGTGLGLAITKRLIHIMNGELELNSRLGIGTTFSIKLKNISIWNHAMEMDLITQSHKIHQLEYESPNIYFISKSKSIKDKVANQCSTLEANLILISGIENELLHQIKNGDFIIIDKSSKESLDKAIEIINRLPERIKPRLATTFPYEKKIMNLRVVNEDKIGSFIAENLAEDKKNKEFIDEELTSIIYSVPSEIAVQFSDFLSNELHPTWIQARDTELSEDINKLLNKLKIINELYDNKALIRYHKELEKVYNEFDLLKTTAIINEFENIYNEIKSHLNI
ncbi:PAS domain-containing sensor histidine kinase [Aureibacter tunicatorum]|uniref:histidine kinase n=1 Tax=Aureibacter tunicatorum TaxID=866807 RepID=A0AAE3XNU2_9BACT|nr:ATP-binding protein [Aureibacter tunicatorum]MDR6239176.1 PAS domain S-box-containing protein [Aureibacter tunicatorum]BDD04898.1 hypothetical protein AUTU_23810 [Aureibacter tunicatorum]